MLHREPVLFDFISPRSVTNDRFYCPEKSVNIVLFVVAPQSPKAQFISYVFRDGGDRIAKNKCPKPFFSV